MLQAKPAVAARVTQDGAIVLGTPASSKEIADLHLDLNDLGTEGYTIVTLTIDGHRATVIAANSGAGELYGVFHFLRLMQTRQPLDRLSIRESPHIQRRVLNHWDNLDGTVERGYAGASLWDWHNLPDYLPPRYTGLRARLRLDRHQRHCRSTMSTPMRSP